MTFKVNLFEQLLATIDVRENIFKIEFEEKSMSRWSILVRESVKWKILMTFAIWQNVSET